MSLFYGSPTASTADGGSSGERTFDFFESFESLASVPTSASTTCPTSNPKSEGDDGESVSEAPEGLFVGFSDAARDGERSLLVTNAAAAGEVSWDVSDYTEGGTSTDWYLRAYFYDVGSFNDAGEHLLVVQSDDCEEVQVGLESTASETPPSTTTYTTRVEIFDRFFPRSANRLGVLYKNNARIIRLVKRIIRIIRRVL
eukprot:6435397-Pyramimonas_sp.AAC.1